MNNDELNWYVLYTQSKHERKIQYFLEQKNVETFFPTRTEIRQWSDRKKKVRAALFPNYLFVKINPSEQWDILSIPGAFRFIGSGKTPSIVKDSIIHSIQKAVIGKVEIGTVSMIKGDEVRITNGSFMGLEGKFIRKGGRSLVVIEIDFLNRSVIVELKPDQVLKLEKIESVIPAKSVIPSKLSKKIG